MPLLARWCSRTTTSQNPSTWASHPSNEWFVLKKMSRYQNSMNESTHTYHLESRNCATPMYWLYDVPLLFATFWEWLVIYFHHSVSVFYISDHPHIRHKNTLQTTSKLVIKAIHKIWLCTVFVKKLGGENGECKIEHWDIHLLYYTLLFYSILYCTILYCTVLYCIVLYCTVLFQTILYVTIFHYTILYYTTWTDARKLIV